MERLVVARQILFHTSTVNFWRVFPMTQWLKNLLAMQEIQETWVQSLGGKIPWRRKWQPIPYSCLENSMDRGAWWAMVHGVTNSRTWLSKQTHIDKETKVKTVQQLFKFLMQNLDFKPRSSESRGFPGGTSGISGKESACQCKRYKRCGFDHWVQKIPWRRKWQPTPGFLPGKFHGQRRLVGYSSWSCEELDLFYPSNIMYILNMLILA